MKWTFAWTIVYGRSADKTDIRFLRFADAASLLGCCESSAVLQH